MKSKGEMTGQGFTEALVETIGYKSRWRGDAASGIW
jgi:hypothetical protein